MSRSPDHSFFVSLCGRYSLPNCEMGRVSKQRRHIQRLAVARPAPAADDNGTVIADAEGTSLFANHDVICEDAQWTGEHEHLPIDLVTSEDTGLDVWVQQFSDEQIDDISNRCWLQWKNGAGSQLRKAHNGTGRSTFFARQAEKRRMVESMSGCKNLLHYFSSKSAIVEPPNEVDCEAVEGDQNLLCSVSDPDVPKRSIEEAIEKLRKIVQIRDNSRLEKRRGSSQFDFIRHVCILRYLEKIEQNPRSRIKSSIEVAAIVFSKDDGRRSHKSNSIIAWGDEFVRSHELMSLRQGKHQKKESLIDDSDIRFACLSYLRSVRPETITGHAFSLWVSESLHKIPELTLDNPVNIHRNTAIQWLHAVGFRKLQHKKGTYTDGHERPDVVAYRSKCGQV